MKLKSAVCIGVVAFIISERLEGSLKNSLVWDLISVLAWPLLGALLNSIMWRENPSDGHNTEFSKRREE